MKTISMFLLSMLIPMLCTTMASSQELSVEGLSETQLAKLQQALEQASVGSFLEASGDFWNTERHELSDATKNRIRELIGARAKTWLLAEGALDSHETSDLQGLLAWAARVLNANERKELLAELASIHRGGENGSFSDMRDHYELSNELLSKGYLQREESRQQVVEWIAGRQLSELATDKLNWSHRMLAASFKGKDGFTVVWNGFLTVPRDGEYIFSTSPWKVSVVRDEGGHVEHHRQTLTVQLDGTEVLKAGPDSWPGASEPITLSDSEQVPVRVEFRYERNEAFRLCPAILYWSGPGIAKSVVPASAFTTDGQGTPGLQAEYAWKNETAEGVGEAAIKRVVDPNIEFLWVNGLTIGAHSGALRQLGQEYLSRWLAGEDDFLGNVGRRPALVSLLTCDELSACLEVLVESQDWEEVSSSRFWLFWIPIRCGAEEQALDLLGTWLQRHSDIAPNPTANLNDYFENNRKVYRRYSERLAFEYPEGMTQLQERYLETPSGACCLPVAYTLGYCHMTLGTIEEWIGLLSDRLADRELTGDQRVNWLLARAMAEEISRCPAGRNNIRPERLSAGTEWLQEAELYASAPAVVLRLKKERIARQAALQQWPSAEQAVQETPELAEWASALSELKQASVEQQQQTKDQANAAYLAELKRRQQRASAKGNSAAVNRYSAIISQLEDDQ